MITLEEYFRKPRSEAQERAAELLLARVHALLQEADAAGAYEAWVNPWTRSCISGSKDGDGDGGFRTPGSKTGAPNSSHKQAQAVDVYDPHDILDDWITDDALVRHGLYREHPDATKGWCHLTTRAPGSGFRTFRP